MLYIRSTSITQLGAAVLRKLTN